MIRQLGAPALTLLACCFSACTGNNEPVDRFKLYQQDAAREGAAVVPPEVVDEQIGRLSPDETGTLTQLYYTRTTIVEEGSGWEEITRYRAKSYASALRMLRERGISTPVLVSASMIDGYLKYHNDRWYAALEHALDRMIPGSKQGRTHLAEALLAAIAGANIDAPRIKQQLEMAKGVAEKTPEQLRELWREDPFQYKQLSFYSGDETLERLWTYDRALLALIGESQAGIDAFNALADQPDEAVEALMALRDLFGHVTNRHDPALFSDDPFSMLNNQDRKTYACSGPCGHLWPSSSPGILERLPDSQRSAYDQVGLAQPPMQELIDLTTTDAISLQPRPDEGFFIHQRYALEALLTFQQHPESDIVVPGEMIFEMWEEAFKAGTAKALETHQKVVDTGMVPVSAGPPPSTEQLLVEPIPTLYQRYAQQYAYLLGYIETLPDAFVVLWQVDAVGIKQKLTELRNNMLALYVLATKQLRMPYAAEMAQAIADQGETELIARAAAFIKTLHQDPAMSEDQRFIAVQGRPGGSKAQSCNDKPAVFWTTFGIEAVPVEVSASLRHDRYFVADMVVLVDRFAELKVCVDAPPTRAEWRTLLMESSDSSEAQDKLAERF